MCTLNQQFSEAVQVVSTSERPSLGQLSKRMADKGGTPLRKIVYKAYPRGSSALVLVVNDQAVSRAPLGFILSINEKKRHLKWQQKAILVRPNKR
jgi:hypothetical protein